MRQPAMDCPSMELPLVAPLRSAPRPITSEQPAKTPSLLSRVEPIPPTDSPKRILGIDIENGTRWGWGPHGYTYSIIYSVSRKWVGTPDEECESFWIDWRHADKTLRRHLEPLFQDIAAADAFLGHNFQHDWKGISGLARDLGLPFPEKKPIIDTFKDIPRHDGASKSLEDLCLQFGLGDKPHLPQREWVDAFIRNKPEAILRVRQRNEADVILTERLYLKEKELGWLPRMKR